MLHITRGAILSRSSKKKGSEPDTEIVSVYTRLLFDLNQTAQNAVRDFALHDIDDKAGLETRRIAMHDAFTTLYDEVAEFSEEIMGEEFDLAYLRNRLATADGETREQLEKEIEDRRHAEAALRESEKEFRELVDLLPQTVFETDVNANVKFANRHGFGSFGYSPEDIDKATKTWFKYLKLRESLEE